MKSKIIGWTLGLLIGVPMRFVFVVVAENAVLGTTTIAHPWSLVVLALAWSLDHAVMKTDIQELKAHQETRGLAHRRDP